MRMLLVVLSMLGIFVVWEARKVHARKMLRQQIIEGGGVVDGEGRGEQSCVTLELYNRNIYQLGRASSVPCWRAWIGDDDINVIILPSSATDAERRRTMAMFPEVSSLEIYPGEGQSVPFDQTPPPLPPPDSPLSLP